MDASVLESSPLYVVAHGLFRRIQGLEPSVTYGNFRSPSEAYDRALEDLSRMCDMEERLTEDAILSILTGEVISPLAGLEGIYVGFSPTDESFCRMGEMKLTITPFTIGTKMATGLRIKEDELLIPLFNITEADQDVARSMFRREIPEGTTIRMFLMDGNPWLLLIRDTQEPNTDCVRLFLGEMTEMLGPTILFTPERVEAGDLEKAIKDIESDYGEPGVMPRLSTGGEAPRYYRQESA